MDIWLNYVDQILIFALLAVSLNLLLGYAGQVSVAHAAFAAVGGYVMGWLVQLRHWPYIPAILVGIAFAFVVGFVVSLPALKLTVEYLILLTLAVSFVIIAAFVAIKSLGGQYGLIEIFEKARNENERLAPLNVFGVHLVRPRDWVIPLAVCLAIIYAICWRIGESPYGRVLKGIREDATVAQALGKNVFNFKVMTFSITSAMAGFGGALYSGWLHLATPGLYGFSFSLTIFAIVIFGGIANFNGSLFGAAVLVLIDPFLKRVLHMDATRRSIMQLIIYGLLLVVLMMVRPQGLLPEGWAPWRRSSKARLQMAGESWTPDVKVKIREGEHQPDAAEQTEREERWQAADVVLSARFVSKRFGGIVAADELSLDLRKGTITALVGPNGAGKTTVFNLLTGFIRPDGGSVVLGGQELVGLGPHAIARRGVVRTFQDVRLVQRVSCLQNVMMAVQHQSGEQLRQLFFGGPKPGRAEKVTREKAMEWLAFVGMSEFADVPAGAVSYGQSKLVSLARALATEAPVLLLDEPASGIDAKWLDTMLDLIEAVREQGRTVCIVEHNLHVVGRLADHTYFMDIGRIVAEGTFNQLTNTPQLAEAYFGT